MERTFLDCLKGIMGVAFQAGFAAMIYTVPTNIAFAIACRYRPLPGKFQIGYIWIILDLVLSLLMICWGGYWWTVRGVAWHNAWQVRVLEVMAILALISILMQPFAFRNHLLPVCFLVISEIIAIVMTYWCCGMAVTNTWL